MPTEGSRVRSCLDNNEVGAATVGGSKINVGLVVRNVEALDAGGWQLEGDGAGDAKGESDGDSGELMMLSSSTQAKYNTAARASLVKYPHNA